MNPKNIVLHKVVGHISLKTSIKKILILIVKMLFFIVKMLFLIVKMLILIMKMLIIVMILMLIEYYYLKAAINILLDTNIQIKWILYHYN